MLNNAEVTKFSVVRSTISSLYESIFLNHCIIIKPWCVCKNAFLNNSSLPSLQNVRRVESFLTSSDRPFHEVGAAIVECAASCKLFPAVLGNCDW